MDAQFKFMIQKHLLAISNKIIQITYNDVKKEVTLLNELANKQENVRKETDLSPIKQADLTPIRSCSRQKLSVTMKQSSASQRKEGVLVTPRRNTSKTNLFYSATHKTLLNNPSDKLLTDTLFPSRRRDWDEIISNASENPPPQMGKSRRINLLMNLQ